MKKIIIALIIVLSGCITTAYSQFSVTGNNPAWEGSVQKYIVTYSGQVPAGLNLQFSVSGGNIQSAAADPYSGTPVSVTVLWNCGVTAGTITLSNASPAISVTYPVTVWSAGNAPAFCTAIDITNQHLVYAQLPQPLTVTNCSPFCTGSYGFSYRWRAAGVSGEVIPGQFNWVDIPGATGVSYQPPAMTAYGNTAYQRVTIGNGAAAFYSEPAYTRFLDYLRPGSLGGGQAVAYNTQPTVTQTPAGGGQCPATSYTYTWERSIENGPWQVIGTGVDYPVDVPVTGDCALRRKVQCGNEYAYTGPVYYTLMYTSPNAENLNYVRTNTITIPGIYTWPQADQLPAGRKVQVTTYLDGFGRPVQTVTQQASQVGVDPDSPGSYRDIVSMQQYDGLGRADKSLLPYVAASNNGLYKTDALAAQPAFTAAYTGNADDAQYAFARTQYDGSPLNRVINTKPPGAGWNSNPQYRGISTGFEIYKGTEGVRAWEIGYNPGSMPYTDSVYPSGSLVKRVTKDDRGKGVLEYTNKSGQVVLKKVQDKEPGAGLDTAGHSGWLCTYYVYDDFAQLRYTIPAKAVELLAAGNWIMDSGIKNGLCFYTEYDHKGRAIVKHSPDKGEVWAVYDSRNRLVYSQDDNQRAHTPPQWGFALYDEQDRSIASGLVDLTISRTALQDRVNGLHAQNVKVSLYTGAAETLTAYNPVAGTNAQTGAAYCPDATLTTVNTLSYYDGYTTTSQPFETLSTSDFAPTTSAYTEPLQKTLRVKALPTGSKVRVLDDKYDNGIHTDDRFLSSTVYYDQQGRVLQTLADHILGGTDMSSIQYDYAGKVLSSHSKHRNSGNAFDNLITISRSDYDLLQRPYKTYTLITLNPADIGNTAKYKLLSEVKYDALGRVKTKKIGADPTNPAQPLETQNYSYNIQGWLTGINRDYALAQYAGTPGYGQWERRFGFYLGYDNADGKLPASARFDGNSSGMVWRSQGDNIPRRYLYEYDNIGRFTAATFTQVDGFDRGNTTWTNTTVNLGSTVSGYDANGNILQLKQWGIAPGTTGGQLIDDLGYSYYNKSNRLKAITDNAFNNGLQNGTLGDFKAATGVQQYGYDGNGNLLYDLNKNITAPTGQPLPGMRYNFLDQPQTVDIAGKSKTEYIYDAAGSRLAKKVTPMVNGVAGTASTTFYAGAMVYKDQALQYLLTGEGRLRMVQPAAGYTGSSQQVYYRDIRGTVQLKDTAWGVWDYFITDHLGNLRMTLTEQYYEQQMLCAMDNPGVNNAAAEERAAFGQAGSANEVEVTRTPTAETPWTANTSSHVAGLRGTPTTAIGPNAILKVMAGDAISGRVDYYYRIPAGTEPQNDNILGQLAGSLVAAMNGNLQGLVKDNAATIIGNQSGTSGPLVNFFEALPPRATTRIRAYVNYLFFDEQFNFVAKGSGAVPVAAAGSLGTATGSLAYSATAPKNGYVYVYLSNESRNVTVYYDNLIVNHKRGAIIEDNAYYPHGLKIQGISARAAILNKAGYGYQGAFAEEDDETGYNSFALRQYDPQTGRWVQTDPYDVEAGMYNGMGNNPVNMTDPDGGDPVWGRKANTDGSVTHKWFDGPTVPEGWINEGYTVPTFLATNGLYASLYDHGKVVWSENPIQAAPPELQASLAPQIVNPIIFNLPPVPVSLQGSPTPASERSPVSLMSPEYLKWSFMIRPSQDYLREITPQDEVQRYLARNPDNFGAAWIYGAAQSAHNFNQACRDGDVRTAIAYGGLFAIDLAPPLVGQGKSSGTRLWEVGPYNRLRGVEPGLDAHHAGQKAVMNRLVPGYNENTAPSILVPEVGHTIRGPNGIVSRRTAGFTNARQVLARDIFELRRVYGSQGITNGDLERLIQMNKTMYPQAFRKE